MYIKTLNLGNMDNNCYIVADETTKKAAVIDAPCHAAAILDALEEDGLTCKYILLTHAHFDHIGAVDELRKATGAPVAIHSFEYDALTDPQVNLALYEDAPYPSENADIKLVNEDIINVGNLEITALYTPGHTVGGMCYYVEDEDCLFSGDTLFQLSIGRTDFPGGDYDIIKKSIRDQLYILPDDTDVYPGHGMPTTIGYEKRHNQFIQENWDIKDGN